jgi:hypothetical protein
MKYRNLRIAWSVTCGILFLLLIGLWVRSLSTSDLIVGKGTASYFVIESGPGNFGLTGSPHLFPLSMNMDWSHRTIIAAQGQPLFSWMPRFARIKSEAVLLLPTWMVFVLFVTLGAAPWIRWRFGLRTLLIATTLIGLLLGLIIATTR